jgi:hypothetical protein
MMGTKVRAFAPLCNRSLESLVPSDRFYRHLEAKSDLAFVLDLVRNTYKERGRPSVDPRVFFKTMLAVCIATKHVRLGATARFMTAQQLAVLGGLAALAGGASTWVGALRVTFWGALAMALTAGVGAMFGTVV